jgi:outer membrane receptor protein involved in Fe transport
VNARSTLRGVCPSGSADAVRSQNNVGDAEVWDIEFEAESHPSDALTIDASLSTLDFEYQRIDPGATAVTLGMITPYTPETKASVGLQYAFSLAAALGAVTRSRKTSTTSTS